MISPEKGREAIFFPVLLHRIRVRQHITNVVFSCLPPQDCIVFVGFYMFYAMQQESDLDDSLASADYFDRVDYDYQHTDLERYLKQLDNL